VSTYQYDPPKVRFNGGNWNITSYKPPTPKERIAAALERIAAALEAQQTGDN